MLRKSAKPLIAVAAIAAIAATAGCGVNKDADTAQGRQLFVQSCGSCHALSEAGTKGNIGPNLDDAFKESISNGLGRSTIEGVVKGQIALPQGSQMPANIVKGKQAKQVAEYVAQAVKG